MKARARRDGARRTLALRGLATLIALGWFIGCGGLDQDRRRALDAVDSAIRMIDDNSEAWRDALRHLGEDLDANLRSLVTHELTDLLGQEVALVGVEARCETEFVARKVRMELDRARAQLLGGAPDPKQPFVCISNPVVVDYSHRAGSLEYYGWDLDTADDVVLLDASGAETAVAAKDRTSANTFLVVLDLGETGIPLSSATEKIVLRSAGQIVHEVVVNHGEVAPRCDDGVVGGPETDLDCGGGCPRCAPGLRCRNDSDCRDSICRADRCQIVRVGEQIGEAPYASAGGPGGSRFDERCPPDYVAIGLDMRTGNYVDAAALMCAFLQTDGRLSETHTGRWHGGAGGDRPVRATCDGALVGMELRADRLVDRFTGLCRQPLAIVNADALEPTRTNGGGGMGGNDHPLRCPVGTVVTGVVGQSGDVIDQLGMVCSRLVLQ